MIGRTFKPRRYWAHGAVPKLKPETPSAQRIVVGGMCLVQLDTGEFWLTRSEGEGLQTTPAKLEALLREFFDREF